MSDLYYATDPRSAPEASSYNHQLCACADKFSAEFFAGMCSCARLYQAIDSCQQSCTDILWINWGSIWNDVRTTILVYPTP